MKIRDQNSALSHFGRLHEWGMTPEGQFRSSGPAGELLDELNSTGAVVVGRRTAEQVDHWGGNQHDRGAPNFVLSHRPPGPSVADYLLVTYVTDGIESAMARAKAAAGDRDVVVQGAYTAQRALEAGVLESQAAVEIFRSSAPSNEQGAAMLSAPVAEYDIAGVRPLFGGDPA